MNSDANSFCQLRALRCFTFNLRHFLPGSSRRFATVDRCHVPRRYHVFSLSILTLTFAVRIPTQGTMSAEQQSSIAWLFALEASVREDTCRAPCFASYRDVEYLSAQDAYATVYKQTLTAAQAMHVPELQLATGYRGLSSCAAKQQAGVFCNKSSLKCNQADCPTTEGLNGCWMQHRHKAWVLSTRLCGLCEIPKGRDAPEHLPTAR